MVHSHITSRKDILWYFFLWQCQRLNPGFIHVRQMLCYWATLHPLLKVLKKNKAKQRFTSKVNPEILALGRLKKENGQFRDTLSYKMSLIPAWATQMVRSHLIKINWVWWLTFSQSSCLYFPSSGIRAPTSPVRLCLKKS